MSQDRKGPRREGGGAGGRGGEPRRGGDRRGPQERGSDRPGSDRRGPSSSRGSDSRPSDKRGSDKRGSDSRGGARGGSDRPGYERGGSDRRGGDKRGSDRGGDRRGRPGDSRDRASRDRRDEQRSVDQAQYDGPPIPEEITGRELDRQVMSQLKSLPEKLALRVARHLVAAGLLLEEDPKTAYQHTLAARARAGRLAIVREAVGEAAYAGGEFSEALAELKAARRMNGSHDYLAVMADCERALGRPDRALALVASAKDDLPSALIAELRIVEAGARRDRGEIDAALRILERQPLSSKSREPWVVRLRYAYADTLLAAGRTEEALEWFHRTVAIDAEQATDAAERARDLEHDASTGD